MARERVPSGKKILILEDNFLVAEDAKQIARNADGVVVCDSSPVCSALAAGARSSAFPKVALLPAQAECVAVAKRLLLGFRADAGDELDAVIHDLLHIARGKVVGTVDRAIVWREIECTLPEDIAEASIQTLLLLGIEIEDLS